MRKVEFIAIKDGSIEENLRQIGISSSVCIRLRKRLGLIQYMQKDVFIIQKIKKGEKFSIFLEDEKIKKVEKYDFDVKILYEDDDLAIIDKPYNLAVISTRAHYNQSLENALANKWGDFVYRPVNRLDKDTTGLMIIAKHQLAHSLLAKTKIDKKYLALCSGNIKGEGVIEKPIAKSSTSIMERIISEDGLYSKTYYKVLKNYEGYSLLELTLFTGRTHQIRVHMARIGHALICDTLYGDKNQAEYVLNDGTILKHQALHAYSLDFINPITGKRINIKSFPDYIKID